VIAVSGIYILYGICIRTFVLIFVVRRDLVQVKGVKGVLSGVVFMKDARCQWHKKVVIYLNFNLRFPRYKTWRLKVVDRTNVDILLFNLDLIPSCMQSLFWVSFPNGWTFPQFSYFFWPFSFCHFVLNYVCQTQFWYES